MWTVGDPGHAFRWSRRLFLVVRGHHTYSLLPKRTLLSLRALPNFLALSLFDWKAVNIRDYRDKVSI